MKEPCMCGATDCPSCGPAQGYGECTECGRPKGQGPDECYLVGSPECLDHAEALADEAAEAAYWERDLDPSDRADFDAAVERHFDWVRDRK